MYYYCLRRSYTSISVWFWSSILSSKFNLQVWKIDSISTQPTTATLGQKTGNEPPGGTERYQPAVGLFDYPYTPTDRKPTIAILRTGVAAEVRHSPVSLTNFIYRVFNYLENLYVFLLLLLNQIWDLEADHMVGKLSFDPGASATAIACHPIHPVIVLGTKARVTGTVTISLYNSNDYR